MPEIYYPRPAIDLAGLFRHPPVDLEPPPAWSPNDKQRVITFQSAPVIPILTRQEIDQR